MAIVRRGAAAASAVSGAINAMASEPQVAERDRANKPTNFTKMISTGSTLIDLAISGGVSKEGGLPGGIFVEIFGPSGAGKTALLSEISASTQIRGGQVKFLDPEARLDKEYTQIYGVSIADGDFEYARPDTVSELFTEQIWPWKPKNNGVINTIAADSLAALSTNLEMDKDEGDKMGMRRAKEFSEGLRKTCRLIAHNNWLIVMSNQIRTGDGGKITTPGGQAVPFYSTVRLKVSKGYPSWQIKKEKTIGKATIEQVIGIISEIEVHKNSIDAPYRTAPMSVVFGYGIDTIRDELQWYKKLTAETTYNCFDKNFKAIEDACLYIAESGFKARLKERTIGLWHEVQKKFEVKRPVKERS